MQEFGSHMDPLAVYFLGGWLELTIQDLPKASPPLTIDLVGLKTQEAMKAINRVLLIVATMLT